MIRLHLRDTFAGDATTIRHDVDWHGQTYAELLLEYKLEGWDGVALDVAIDGRLLEQDDLDRVVSDDCDIVAGPHLGLVVGSFLWYVSMIAVMAAASYLIYLLTPKPKPPGLPAERGEEGSQTYAWNGVQTSYGQGQPVALGYGEHDLGGQVVFTNVYSSTAGGKLSEKLEIVLALCEGRIESIGGVTGGERGEANGLNNTIGKTLPENVRVNSNLLDTSSATPGAQAWLRCGELSQSTLPSPFAFAASTFTVGEALNDVNDYAIFTASSTEVLNMAFVVLVFPSGLYQQDQQGNVSKYPVDFQMEWRFPGARQGWNAFWTSTGGALTTRKVGNIAGGSTSILTETFGGFFANPNNPMLTARGPVEIRVKRLTPAGAGGTQQTVSSCQWRQVVTTVAGTFQYPRVSLLALELSANENASGGMPQVQVRAKLKRVRVWDKRFGWSSATWEVPAAPFNFMQFPPGQNPAWIALDFLLAKTGLGHWVKESNIDLDSFRAWSIFCDEQPGPSGSEWAEPRFRFDGVMDRSRPAWEWLLAICSAGRAAPMLRGNKIAVKYQYRDGHSDFRGVGGPIVPAKAKTQLFTDANIENPVVEYLGRSRRATVHDFQFLNDEKAYRQDVLPVEESASFLAHLSEVVPLRTRDFRRETHQAFGITRPSQIFRDGVFMHRAARLIRKQLTFKTGIWALAAEPGDVIAFQHDVLRPYDDQALGLTIAAGGVATTSIMVDRPLTLSAGTNRIIVRNPAGGVSEVTVNSSAAPAAGDPGSTLTLATELTVNAGAPAAFGRVNKVTQDYEIVSIGLDVEGMREVSAVQWVPAVHEEPPAGSAAALTGFITQADDLVGPDLVAATDVRLVRHPVRPAACVISFSKPLGRRNSRARVYLRPVGSDSWWALPEVSGEDSEIEQDGLGPFEDWEVAVCVEDDRGVFPMPDQANLATLTVPEFPAHSPPNPSNFVVKKHELGWFASWDSSSAAFDYYEIRQGDQWVGASTVYRGREASTILEAPPIQGAAYWLAIRSSSGLYSLEPVSSGALALNRPLETIAGATAIDEIPPLSGLPADLAYNASTARLEFAAGSTATASSSYALTALSLGYKARAFWSATAVLVETDGATVDDWDFEIDSGEARWQTVDAREASPSKPGVDLAKTVDDLAIPIDDLEAITVTGERGEPAAHTHAVLETRFDYGDGSFSDWLPHRNQWHIAAGLQGRLQLVRDSTEAQAGVSLLEMRVAL